MSFQSLFKPRFGDNPFVAELTQKPWVGNNPKEHVKRALVEISETVDNPMLAYSGGMDSGFVLRCLAELREEGFDKIDVFYGVAYAEDQKRALKYARSIGINPMTIDFPITISIMDDVVDLGRKYKVKDMMSVLQEVWRRRIDATVIKSVCCFGENVFLKNKDRYRITSHKFWQYLPDSNCVDVFDWDIEVFSSMISRYFVERRHINCDPFYLNEKREPFNNPFNPYSFDASMYKWLMYLDAYPDLAEIFFKFPTTFATNSWERRLIHMARKRLLDIPIEYQYGFIEIDGQILTEENANELISH